MRSWSTDAGDVRNDPLIAAELAGWLRSPDEVLIG
jgi:hypothetical protein